MFFGSLDRPRSNHGTGLKTTLMPFFRPRRRGAVNVAVVDDQVERLQLRIRRIAAMHGLAAVTDDDVLHQPPDDVVEDGHAEQGEAPGPGDEDRADGDEGDARRAVEVFLKVELIVVARRAAADDRARRRRGYGSLGPAMLANALRLTRFTGEPFFALAA